MAIRTTDQFRVAVALDRISPRRAAKQRRAYPRYLAREGPEEVKIYDREARRMIVRELAQRSIKFMERSVEARKTLLRVYPVDASTFDTWSVQQNSFDPTNRQMANAHRDRSLPHTRWE